MDHLLFDQTSVMKQEYLGDSYDAVKRMWRELLASTAPLFAHPRFIPVELQADFNRLTGIPILPVQPPAAFSILNDPDTGVRLPDEKNQSEGRRHVSISTILGQLRLYNPLCIITFDQSHYRQIDLSLKEQRLSKMRTLSLAGAHSFYYVSHTPFLFVFPTAAAFREVREILEIAGIPSNRFEQIGDSSNC